MVQIPMASRLLDTQIKLHLEIDNKSITKGTNFWI